MLKLAGKPIFFPVLDLSKFLVEVVYLQSLLSGLWWHTWSLAVEEHFYFLLAHGNREGFYKAGHHVFPLVFQGEISP